MPDTTVPRGYPYPIYTDPTMDFPQAIQDLATNIDGDMTVVSGRIAGAGNRPSVRMTSGVTQAVASGVSTNLTFAGGGVAYDNHGMANLAANRLELGQSGVYFITGRIVMTAGGSGTGAPAIRVSILSSGGVIPVVTTTTRLLSATQDGMISVSGLHYKGPVGTDFITLQVQTIASGPRNFTFRNLCAAKISNLPGGS